jgi:AraC-like DNA-binding protein
MKPILQKLPLSVGLSFLIDRFETPYFETPWHHHDEIEIVICDGGYGKKFIGNHVSDYQKGDLMIIGSNLPHCFIADDVYYKTDTIEKPASIVLQFQKNCFGNSFFEINEMSEINKLLEISKQGISFFGETKFLITQKLKSMIFNNKIEKITGLLYVLDLMAKSKEYKILSNIEMIGKNFKDSKRMNLIIEYVLNNFQHQIELKAIAALTKLSEPAFCRYFKTRTQKTFVSFVNEVRLDYSAKLLRESELNIAETCFESGFNNLSNFNRQFKAKYFKSPKAYRNSF